MKTTKWRDLRAKLPADRLEAVEAQVRTDLQAMELRELAGKSGRLLGAKRSV